VTFDRLAYHRDYEARRRAALRATLPPTTRERVLAVLTDGPQTAPAVIAALGDGYEPEAVRYHLRRLVAQGVVVVERRARRYRGDALSQYRLAGAP
jgi:predicted ArsR family transcriptional regulator